MEATAMIPRTLSWCWEDPKAAILLSFLLIAVTWWILLRPKAANHKALLPPGPWGLPLIGNILFLDPDLHRGFAKLSKKYGAVMKLYLGTRLSIVLSSPEVAKEVLKDHDANFADRDVPALAAAGTSGLAFVPYGEHWRMLRKICVKELLSHGRLEALYWLRRREAREMVVKVHSKTGDSVDIGELVLLTMFSIVTSMIWGNTLDGEERHRVTAKFREFANKLVKLVMEPNVSDLFPVLAPYDIQGKVGRMKENLKWFDQIFEFIIEKRRKMECPEDPESKGTDKENRDFLQVLLQLVDQGGQKVELTTTHLKALLVDLTVAGTSTTSTTVEWAMAELLKQPKIIKKIQEELDQVIGPNKVVEETDLPNLHYLDAVIKEVFRLHPTAPLLIPRCPRESCIIGGYLIPKGARVFVNVWAIQRDSKYWNDPQEFRPERFLNSGNEWDYNGNDFRYLPFGSGRRICVGIYTAEKLVAYLLASLLHSFNWELPQGTQLDMMEEFGLELKKKIPLLAVPTARLSDPKIYQ